MKRNLLIVGAGIYGLVAYEIAADIGCFEGIDFIDDTKETSYNGMAVIGGIDGISENAEKYEDVVVAIGNPKVRLSLISKIQKERKLNLISLISPRAYIAESASIEEGCIVEPMAVVHSNCVLSKGCIISAGAVINHGARCGDGVHVDCNATVCGGVLVPEEFKVNSGSCYNGKVLKRCDDSYSFDVGM